MDMRLFEYTAEIYKKGSFTKAADSLHIAQPSLSQQIKKLEGELGFPLFYRKRGAVSPTPQGMRFIQRAQDILRARDDLLREMQDQRQGMGTGLSIGVPAVTGGHLLPPLLKTFFEKHPGVRVQLIEESPAALEQMTEKGEIDLAILPLPIDNERLVTVPILTEPLFLAVPFEKQSWMTEQMQSFIYSVRRETEKRAVSLQAAEDVPFILLKEGYGFRRTVLDLCAKAGFKPKVTFKTSSIETAQSLVENGMGVTIVPQMVMRKSSPRLVYVPLQSAPTRTIVFAYSESCYVSLAAQAFMETAQNSLKKDLL
ncbi:MULTISPECIES: LysR family transcriptional regulator [Bacillus]|uniref:LysR family transcriptional regulator n=1 Tax=Bacillus glycinifermentans TaxID=1664069 RepID=A0AAJ3Z1Y1_9BACI|nr:MULTISPECIES: LysR family transcriptional regulator [Bacillus]KKB74449.1 LysR family transcriptional regulator [Bacillus sp. TH008]MDU0070309.1 LysR substrate-binding domain-containing protein [Bacillus sp. IG6]MED8018249.1 LysR substrate-binding domain-containing protein [Bacillus glycinifermentans]QAT67283.1 LysR family transcriptional regulator [Bacillus glycinifermentans]WKB76927.1 LysR substrate-binding domain-containing protein [Bacillus glycinifermentans]